MNRLKKHFKKTAAAAHTPKQTHKVQSAGQLSAKCVPVFTVNVKPAIRSDAQPIFNSPAYIQGQQAYSSRAKGGKFENPTLRCGPGRCSSQGSTPVCV